MKIDDLGHFKFGILIAISFILIQYGCDKPAETENKAPTCSITSPVNGEEIQQGSTVTISVDADDTDGNVTEVRFYVDGTGVGSSSSFPYNYDWATNGETTGSHTLKATAKDNSGESTTDEIAIFLTDGGSSGNEPVAAFTASQTSVSPGSSVQFTDQSTNDPTSWSWDFGDDGTDTIQNPIHTYNSAGTYSVSLTATNNIGSDIETKTDYITVNAVGQAPIAAFTASQTSIIEGTSISFTDQSTNEPTSWLWDFGDGGTDTSQNPSHSYSSLGYFDVSLAVTNSYGSDTVFKTNYITVTTSGGETGTVSDYDGNTYNTIKIGTQWWMAENLKTTHYANGTEIQLIESNSTWYALGYDDKAMCYNDNSSTNANTYGALYTWAAAMNGANSSSSNPSNVHGVCPSGWHLPSDAEWKQLEMYLGMSQADADDTGFRGTNEGSRLAGNSGLWNDGDLENDAAFGTSGFTALPGSFRNYDGNFYGLGCNAAFWSATENDSSNAWDRGLSCHGSGVGRGWGGNDKGYGFSVRCIQD